MAGLTAGALPDRAARWCRCCSSPRSRSGSSRARPGKLEFDFNFDQTPGERLRFYLVADPDRPRGGQGAARLRAGADPAAAAGSDSYADYLADLRAHVRRRLCSRSAARSRPSSSRRAAFALLVSFVLDGPDGARRRRRGRARDPAARHPHRVGLQGHHRAVRVEPVPRGPPPLPRARAGGARPDAPGEGAGERRAVQRARRRRRPLRLPAQRGDEALRGVSLRIRRRRGRRARGRERLGQDHAREAARRALHADRRPDPVGRRRHARRSTAGRCGARSG